MARRIWLGRKRDGRLLCCSGRPNTCNNLTLLEADESQFHDDPLQQSTREINAIFGRLRDEAPEGTHLAMIDTGSGLLLVWAEATDRPPDLSEFVRYESPPEEKQEFLRLRAEASAA